MKNSRLVVEESRRELASVTEAKLGQVGTLIEDFQGRMEGSLRAVQGNGAKQAKGLEKIAQELGGQWSQQFQKQAEAVLESLREEVKNSQLVVEESKRELASVAEAKLGQVGTLIEDFQGRTEGSLQAVQVNGAKQREELEKTAQELGGRWSQQFQMEAEAAAERLREEVENSRRVVEVSKQALQGSGAKQAEEFQRAAQELGVRWSQQFQMQAEAAVEKLREEVKSSRREMEESKRQLSRLVEAKVAYLSQVAANAASGFEAERKRKSQYEGSRPELGNLEAAHSTQLSRPSFPHENRLDRRGIIAPVGVMAGVFLVIMAIAMGEHLSSPRRVLQLQPEAPAEFIDQSPEWSSVRRIQEELLAQAYWNVAVLSLQQRYPFGTELPVDPHPNFKSIGNTCQREVRRLFPKQGARYWEKLRRIWVQRRPWIESHGEEPQWVPRLRQVWEQLKGKSA